MNAKITFEGTAKEISQYFGVKHLSPKAIWKLEKEFSKTLGFSVNVSALSLQMNECSMYAVRYIIEFTAIEPCYA